MHTGTPGAGRRRCARPARSSSRISTRTTAARRAPTRRDHRHREPVLPGHPPPAAGTRPLARDATPDQVTAHDRQTAETARYKLGWITADDPTATTASCAPPSWEDPLPAAARSMVLDRQRPEILTPPSTPRPAAASRPSPSPRVCAKTAQKHDYPSAAHRRSYTRRTAAERTFATAKDPASNDISRGWCRLMGLTPIMLWLACMLAVRNQRIIAAYTARQAATRSEPQPGCRPKPTAGAAKPSPASPPPRHNQAQPPRKRSHTALLPPPAPSQQPSVASARLNEHSEDHLAPVTSSPTQTAQDAKCQTQT